jgi:hypothetical protein
MNACNGITKPLIDETVEITRLEPVIIEVQEDNVISSHLILFELIAKMDINGDEIVVNGEVQETVFQTQTREYEEE